MGSEGISQGPGGCGVREGKSQVAGDPVQPWEGWPKP